MSKLLIAKDVMYKIDMEEATVSDAKHILTIQKKAYLSEAEIYDDYQIPPLTQSLTEIKSDFCSHTFHVAKIDQEIVGGINIKVVGNRGFIGRLIVSPEMQGQGIGTLLMEYIESNYLDLEVFELFTGHKSERNLSFYKKRGYRVFKRQVVHKKLAFIFMHKIINNKQIGKKSPA
jgi:N-acetylglutamate synthase-like GNAT family acetyltransferase